MRRLRLPTLPRLSPEIPRYQSYLFWALIAGIGLLAVIFLRGCEQAQQRLSAPEDNTPIAAPTSSGDESTPVALANDAQGSVALVERQYALPEEPTTRARALLEHLLSDYALPGSTHPLASGPAVDDVFLLKLPIVNPAGGGSIRPRDEAEPPGMLAIINLRSSFAENHPSGIEVEDLTVRSIVGTLHANFPDLTEVRFLVDGQPRETLAGHADLERTYPAVDTSIQPSQPSNDVVRTP